MSSNTNTNAWLRAQRKSDLVELADSVGLKNYESYKKSELEAALDDYLAENSAKFASRSDLTGYFNSRSKALGSPVKKETIKDDAEKTLKVAKRKASKVADELADGDGSSTAVVRTPGRSLSQVAARIPLPATPADVASAVDRSTLAMRKRVSSIYQESGIDNATQATRSTLSTVKAVLLTVQVFELFFIRKEVLSDRYAFTIPAVSALGTSEYPVHLPDMFLILTADFWSPALAWLFISFIVPSIFGFFFNLSAASSAGPRTRSKTAHSNEYNVDPLTFSIAKAVLMYTVFAQGYNFGGLVSNESIRRINAALYGGYKGVLAGTAITGLVSIYDAILRK